jgi:hypothetical protein
VPGNRKSVLERLLEKVDLKGPIAEGLGHCWLYEAAKSNDYGRFWLNGKLLPAHTAAYLLFVGKIGSGLEPHHLCLRKQCIRPSHLKLLTRSQHVRLHDGAAGIHARKTHCIKGHPLSGANLKIMRRTRRNQLERVCLTCARERRQRHSEKQS